MASEGDLKRDIMEFLKALPGCYARVIQVKGIKGRKSLSRGISDIICVYKGLAVAIEVKTNDGYLSDDQKIFMAEWINRGGGVAFIARSLDDVIEGMRRVAEQAYCRCGRTELRKATSVSGLSQ